MAKAKSQSDHGDKSKSVSAKAKAKGAESAAAKPAAKKSAKASKPAGQPSGMPLIDTGLAAQNAAKLVANRDHRANSGGEARQTESSSFKQLKESLNKPASHAASAFLQNTAPQKKSNLPFGGANQVGKGQTFGADVNRSGVPRRTGG